MSSAELEKAFYLEEAKKMVQFQKEGLLQSCLIQNQFCESFQGMKNSFQKSGNSPLVLSLSSSILQDAFYLLDLLNGIHQKMNEIETDNLKLEGALWKLKTVFSFRPEPRNLSSQKGEEMGQKIKETETIPGSEIIQKKRKGGGKDKTFLKRYISDAELDPIPQTVLRSQESLLLLQAEWGKDKKRERREKREGEEREGEETKEKRKGEKREKQKEKKENQKEKEKEKEKEKKDRLKSTEFTTNMSRLSKFANECEETFSSSSSSEDHHQSVVYDSLPNYLEDLAGEWRVGQFKSSTTTNDYSNPFPAKPTTTTITTTTTTTPTPRTKAPTPPPPISSSSSFSPSKTSLPPTATSPSSSSPPPLSSSPLSPSPSPLSPSPSPPSPAPSPSLSHTPHSSSPPPLSPSLSSTPQTSPRSRYISLYRGEREREREKKKREGGERGGKKVLGCSVERGEFENERSVSPKKVRNKISRAITKQFTQSSGSQDVLLPRKMAKNELDDLSSQKEFESLSELVLTLTDDQLFDLKFRYAAFLTLSTYTTPLEMLEHLRVRYLALDGEPAKVKVKRLRLVSVVKFWIDVQIQDLLSSPEVTSALFSLLDEISEQLGDSGKSLQKLFETRSASFVEKREELKKRKKERRERVESGDYLDFSWDKISEFQFALSFTNYEFELFETLNSHELLSWNTKEKNKKCLNISNMIGLSNHLSAWVTTELTKKVRLTERIRLLEVFLNICEEFFDLNNFSGAMAIIAGLNNAASRRMKKTWAGIDPNLAAKFNKIEEIMSPDCGYEKYRNHILKCVPPCLPYLGIYLTDLTFLDESNKDTKSGAINFQKRLLMSTTLQMVRLYQSVDYTEKYPPPKFDYVLPFLSSQPLHEDECYIKSQIIEPKDPEEGTGALLQYLSQERSLVKEMIKEERENEKEREKEREEMWQGMKEEIEQLKTLVKSQSDPQK